MLLLIPEIIIKNNKCYHKISGISPELSAKFMQDPAQMAKLLRRENAKCIQITDLNSIDGSEGNISTILDILSNVEIPIQVLGFWQNDSIWASLLEKGVYRIIIPSSYLIATKVFNTLSERFDSSRITAFIEIRSEYDKTGFGNLLKELSQIGIQRILIGELGDINLALGYKFQKYLHHLRNLHFKVTIYNMTRSVADLFDLEYRKKSVYDSFVVGRPLFENAFPCQQIWRDIESVLE